MVWPMIGAKIKLTNAERDEAIVGGRKRYNNNREAGVERGKFGPYDLEFIDVNSYAGEIAGCRLWGVPHDKTFHPRSKLKDYGDCQLPLYEDVWTWCDWKTTHHLDGRPWIEKVKFNRGQIVGLLVGTLPDFEFCGFVMADDLMVPKYLMNPKYKECYMAPRSVLRNLCEIIH